MFYLTLSNLPSLSMVATTLKFSWENIKKYRNDIIKIFIICAFFTILIFFFSFLPPFGHTTNTLPLLNKDKMWQHSTRDHSMCSLSIYDITMGNLRRAVLWVMSYEGLHRRKSCMPVSFLELVFKIGAASHLREGSTVWHRPMSASQGFWARSS
jgi:hypothetical protein